MSKQRNLVKTSEVSTDNFVLNSGNQTIDPTAPQKLSFNEFWVSNNITWDSTNRRFIINKSGIYRITLNPFFNTGVGAGRVLVGVNNDTPNQTTHFGHAYRQSTNYETGSINSVVSLKENDYVVYYLFGGALYNQASDKFNQFSIEMISEEL